MLKSIFFNLNFLGSLESINAMPLANDGPIKSREEGGLSYYPTWKNTSKWKLSLFTVNFKENEPLKELQNCILCIISASSFYCSIQIYVSLHFLLISLKSFFSFSDLPFFFPSVLFCFRWHVSGFLYHLCNFIVFVYKIYIFFFFLLYLYNNCL